jgi:hypothetical protein
MKRKIHKLGLSKETLRDLQEQVLENAAGGATQMRTECGSCPASACHPTFCYPCEDW